MEIELNGNNLTTEKLADFKNPLVKMKISEETVSRILRGRKVIDNIISKDLTVYGVNTGFGSLCDTKISSNDLKKLQKNLIISHCTGVGEFIPKEIARMVFALRINVLLRGNSGMSIDTINKMIEIFNSGLIPCIPCQGSVGASGDLAPLSHLANTLLGNGFMYSQNDKEPKPSKEQLESKGLIPIELGAKEGIAMINGTQFIMGFASEVLYRSKTLLDNLHLIASASVEALLGIEKPFINEVHENRPHPGQLHCAKTMRESLHSKENPSENLLKNGNSKKVQDAYSIRCIPQVHGVAFDTFEFVKKHLEIEMNSSTDNPLVFWNEDSEYYDKEIEGYFISGGNFHGEYPAKMLDFLSIAMHELGSISERRIERLVNSKLSEGLPSFLMKNNGLNSGFMLIQYSAAAIVSENKHLASPASVDSIPTCENKEDHVSMGAWSARKALMIVENVEKILAMELYCACQGIDLRGEKCNSVVEGLKERVRKIVPFITEDVQHNENINKLVLAIRNRELLH